MFTLTHTNKTTKCFGISFSLLNYISDYSTLMEYLFKKDIANVYMEIGKKFHSNMSGEIMKVNLDYKDYKDKDSNIYLSPHSVSNTHVMYYILQNNITYNNLISGTILKEYRVKANIKYKGYSFIIRAVFDAINIDKGNVIELKTTSFYNRNTFKSRNYDMQAYIYSIMCSSICELNKLYFIFVQTSYPFYDFIRSVSKQELEEGKIKFFHKLDLIIDIIEQNNLYHLFFEKQDKK